MNGAEAEAQFWLKKSRNAVNRDLKGAHRTAKFEGVADAPQNATILSARLSRGCGHAKMQARQGELAGREGLYR